MGSWGGDCNQAPETPSFLGIRPTIVSIGEPTLKQETCIDWFAVSIGIDRMVSTKVFHETATQGHKPVQMVIQRTSDKLLGVRLQKARAFEGVQKKEATEWEVPEGQPYQLTGSLEDQWTMWNRASENTLSRREDKHDEEYFGRGLEPDMVPDTVSAPRDVQG